MAYEIVKFEDDAGTSVTVTPDDVRQTFCPNATNQEVQLFLALCATKRLNPFTREAYLVKYGNNPAQMITSRAAFQKRADATPDYEGTEIGVVVLCPDGSIQRIPGEACYPEAGQTLIGGWARVYRKGRKPYYTEVSRMEYDTGKSNWARMPSTMLAKVAETHALRMAFPSAFDGMYTPEEMAQAQEVQATVEPVQEQPVQQQPQQPDITDDDAAWLRDLTAQLVAAGYDEKQCKAWLWQQWQQGGRPAVQTEVERMLKAVTDAQDAEQAGLAGDAEAQAQEQEQAVEADFYEADIEF